jgi:hypothetical protein
MIAPAAAGCKRRSGTWRTRDSRIENQLRPDRGLGQSSQRQRGQRNAIGETIKIQVNVTEQG